jgi:hypothetical protein
MNRVSSGRWAWSNAASLIREVAGHYVFELETQAGAWHMSKLTLRTLYQTGNRDLLNEAAGR